MTDLTLACEDANSKLADIVTVADVDAEDRVGNSLLQIWELRFGHKASFFFQSVSTSLVSILKDLMICRSDEDLNLISLI